MMPKEKLLFAVDAMAWNVLQMKNHPSVTDHDYNLAGGVLMGLQVAAGQTSFGLTDDQLFSSHQTDLNVRDAMDRYKAHLAACEKCRLIHDAARDAVHPDNGAVFVVRDGQYVRMSVDETIQYVASMRAPASSVGNVINDAGIIIGDPLPPEPKSPAAQPKKSKSVKKASKPVAKKKAARK